MAELWVVDVGEAGVLGIFGGFEVLLSAMGPALQVGRTRGCGRPGCVGFKCGRLPIVASSVVKALITERPAGCGRRVDWINYSSSGIGWPQSSGAGLGPAFARCPRVALGRRVRDFSMMCDSWPLLIANDRKP